VAETTLVRQAPLPSPPRRGSQGLNPTPSGSLVTRIAHLNPHFSTASNGSLIYIGPLSLKPNQINSWLRISPAAYRVHGSVRLCLPVAEVAFRFRLSRLPFPAVVAPSFPPIASVACRQRTPIRRFSPAPYLNRFSLHGALKDLRSLFIVSFFYYFFLISAPAAHLA
jgi:hypothetical protein